MSERYDVVIIAGQSNAVGYGFGEADDPFIESDDILELSDEYKIQFVKDENGNSRLDIAIPPILYFGRAREKIDYERANASLANSFAQEYLRAGLLPDGRKLLIVKAAVGGTGFAKRHWTLGGVCRDRMYYMIDKALSYSEDMRIVAFLWHQGEHDAFERAELSADVRKSEHKRELLALFEEIRARYASHNFPIISGEFTPLWMNENKVACDAVLSAIKEVSDEIGCAALVSSAGLTSNGEKNGNGDILHFSREALMEFGKRYFEEYKSLRGI